MIKLHNNSNKNELFNKFVKSGKIEDYLKYRKRLKEDGEESGTRTRGSTKNN